MEQDFGFEAFRQASEELYDEAWYVLLSKQRDYGPDNIRMSPFGEYQGLLTRIFDKVQRAVHLVSTNSDGENESLRDTFLDLMNYGAIGVMLIDDTFPKAKGEQHRHSIPSPEEYWDREDYEEYGLNCKCILCKPSRV